MQSATPLWVFPINNLRTGGISDAGIEMFKGGNYTYYLVREIIQNSRDASVSLPVEVVFEVMKIQKSDFPKDEQFEQILHLCKDLWSKGKDDKARDFFEHVVEKFKEGRIKVLKISDYCTTGLEGGDHEVGKSWHDLVRGTGMSNKPTGGGSYGIGKNAPFALSDFRTIFYSSMNGQDERIFQGFSNLASHLDAQGNMRSKEGGYVMDEEKCASIREKDDKSLLIPEIYRRNKVGLDLFIMGFDEPDNFDDEISESVLKNFWMAIADNELEVRIINDSKGIDETITSHNLEELMNLHYTNPINKQLREKPAGNPFDYYKAYKNPDVAIFEETLPLLGNVKLYFKKTFDVDHGYKSVALIRRPTKMVIDVLDYWFNEPYAAVFLCDNENGSNLLRKLEPPAHDGFKASLYEEGGVKYSSKGRAIRKEMLDFIYKAIDSLKKQSAFVSSHIKGLDDFLPTDIEGPVEGGRQFLAEPGTKETAKLIGIEDEQQKSYESEERDVVKFDFSTAFGDEGGTGAIVHENGTQKRKKKRKVDPEKKGKHKTTGRKDFKYRTFVKGEIGSGDNKTLNYEVIVRHPIKMQADLAITFRGDTVDDSEIEVLKVTDSSGNPLVVKKHGQKPPTITDVIIDGKVVLNLSVKALSRNSMVVKMVGGKQIT